MHFTSCMNFTMLLLWHQAHKFRIYLRKRLDAEASELHIEAYLTVLSHITYQGLVIHLKFLVVSLLCNRLENMLNMMSFETLKQLIAKIVLIPVE